MLTTLSLACVGLCKYPSPCLPLKSALLAAAPSSTPKVRCLTFWASVALIPPAQERTPGGWLALSLPLFLPVSSRSAVLSPPGILSRHTCNITAPLLPQGAQHQLP